MVRCLTFRKAISIFLWQKMCRPRSGRLRFGCIDPLKLNYVCFAVCTPEATLRYQRKRMGSKSMHIIMIHSCYPSTVAFAIQKGLHNFPIGTRRFPYSTVHCPTSLLAHELSFVSLSNRSVPEQTGSLNFSYGFQCRLHRVSHL